MNIAITSLYLPGGSKIGVGYQVHGLANALVRRGHEVTVFSQCEAGPGARYETRVIPRRKQVATFGFAWDLRRIDFSGFDVLNAHGDDWFLWGKRRPWHIHTFHGSCLSEMFNATGLKAKLRMGLLAACEQPTVWLSDTTVAVSENARRTIKGIKHVIPCGVDLKGFHPGEKVPHPVILFVGTMHGRKRGRWLVKVFQEQVKPVVPDAELWCVCGRPDDMRPEEERGITWCGHVNDENLQQLYRAAWVFTLPSTYEGFGVPYIEAMASGTPVITTANPGSVEVTQHGQDGAIVPDTQLGSKLVETLCDTAIRDNLIARGLTRSLNFGWESVCERYEQLYELGQHRPRVHKPQMIGKSKAKGPGKV